VARAPLKYEYRCEACGARFRGRSIDLVLRRAGLHERGHHDGFERLQPDELALLRSRIVLAERLSEEGEQEEAEPR
jgi:hypothetical protein